MLIRIAAAVVLFVVVGVFLYFVAVRETRQLPVPDGFTPFTIPRADMGPGTVFLAKVEDKKAVTIQRVICDKLYLAIEPATESVPAAVSDTFRASELSVAAALEFFKQAIGAEGSVDLANRAEQEVTWGEVSISKYAAEAAYLQDGTPRPVSRMCRERIKQFQALVADAGGGGRSGVFVIVETLEADGLKLEFGGDTGVSARTKLSASLADGSEVDSEVHLHARNQGTSVLEFSRKLNVAYGNPWQIDLWTPESLTSGQIISVRAAPTEYTISE